MSSPRSRAGFDKSVIKTTTDTTPGQTLSGTWWDETVSNLFGLKSAKFLAKWKLLMYSKTHIIFTIITDEI